VEERLGTSGRTRKDVGSNYRYDVVTPELTLHRHSPARPGKPYVFSPNPAASTARCTLFWKLASCPSASSAMAAAMASQTALTQAISDLVKSLSTY